MAENSEKSKRRGRPENIVPYQFKPGQSGNPGGRPKQKPLTEALARLLDDPAVADAVAAAMVKTMRKGGASGAVAFREAADRVEGKVTDKLEVFGLDGLADRLQRARTRK